MAGDIALRLVGLSLVKLIPERLRTSQSRHKSYAEKKVRDVAFMEGEKVLLRILHMKGVMRFGNKGKLSMMFIRPFEVLERVGEIAYKLALPPRLSRVHLVLHVSMLQKYHGDKPYIFDFNTVQLDENLTYEEKPVAILDRQVRSSGLRRSHR
ncbi:uncharacterized protein [Nicotiana tomentosiformis]|uniref:uncharacterized protein n=1 Tax=Nicotiana tomentosiformis TaxID=4098 RepID=UPI00388C83BE